jgi:protein-disulfide isomerase
METNDSKWVDGRLALLSADEGAPDSRRGFAALRERDRGWKRRRVRWMWATACTTAGALAAGICLLAVFSQPACAQPHGCADKAVRTAGSYKQSGTVMAPITLEVYTDYECPSCAVLYRDTMPSLIAQYVNTGKVRLIHRDFPLPQHPHARLAARYANAAGELGYYDAAVERLFSTQETWAKSGDLDGALSAVTPALVMAKVREKVKGEATLDETVTADEAMGRADHLTQTPTIVIVAKGKRQVVPGAVRFSLLQAYLDELQK